MHDEAADFRWLDFASLWRGRAKTTAVERRLLRELLGDGRGKRVLEVGVGEGRITQALAPGAGDYVAVDRHPRFLARLPALSTASPGVAKVGATAYRLPFRPGSFDVVIMVRVYNFLGNPTSVLREFHRVLRPEGRVIVSYHPRPSLATLVDDVRCWLWNVPDARPFRQTFSPGDVERVQPSPVAAWASRVRAVHHRFAEAGFMVEAELPSGFEDYRGFRRLPLSVFVGAAHTFSTVPVFPHRFVLARRIDRPDERSFPGAGPVTTVELASA